MTTEQLLAKLKQYQVASICAVIVVALGGLAFFRADLVPGLQHERDSIEAEWLALRFNKTQSVELTEQLQKLEALVAEIDSRALTRAEKTVNQTYFYQTARHANVDVLEYSQVVEPVAKNDEKDKEESRYERIAFHVRVSGGFSEIANFVHELRVGRHFVRINEFSTDVSSDAGPEVLTVNIQLEGLGIL